MGDISEMRGLVTVISFIGCLVIIISLIPSQFLIAGYEGRTVNPPIYFEAADIQFFAETWNTTLDEEGIEGWYDGVGFGWFKDNDIGGHDLALYYSHANSTPMYINIKHFWSEWIILPYSHRMEWVNGQGVSRGDLLSAEELDTDYSENAFRYIVKCSHFTMNVFFGFNETLYSSPSDAWNHYELNILQGINFDQITTSYNAWSLIGMLLFFQLPEIHWVINALIAIPIWIAIAYLTFILILRAIGAIFGGGA